MKRHEGMQGVCRGCHKAIVFRRGLWVHQSTGGARGFTEGRGWWGQPAMHSCVAEPKKALNGSLVKPVRRKG